MRASALRVAPVLLAACATAEPVPPPGSPAAAAAAAVEVARGEPAAGCAALGIVEGRHLAAFTYASYERAIRALQADAAGRGANYVTLDSVRQPGAGFIVANGRAFRCAPASPEEPHP